MTTERTHRQTSDGDHETVECKVGSGIVCTTESARDRNKNDVGGEKLDLSTLCDEVDAHESTSRIDKLLQAWATSRHVKRRFLEQRVEADRFNQSLAKGRTAHPREQCSDNYDARSQAIIQLLSLN